MYLARALPPLLAIVCEDVFGAAVEALEAARGGAARAAPGGGGGRCGSCACRGLVVQEPRRAACSNPSSCLRAACPSRCAVALRTRERRHLWPRSSRVGVWAACACRAMAARGTRSTTVPSLSGACSWAWRRVQAPAGRACRCPLWCRWQSGRRCRWRVTTTTLLLPLFYLFLYLLPWNRVDSFPSCDK